MKDDLRYFEHDVNARNHPKMKALQAQFGREGRCRFWDLNEMIGSSKGARLDLSKKVTKAGVAVELGLTIVELEAFLAFLSNPEECGLIDYQDGIVTTRRTQESLEHAMKTREAGAVRAARSYSTRKPSEQGQPAPETGSSPKNTDSSPKNDASSEQVRRTTEQRTNERTNEVSSFASESEFEPPVGAPEAPPSGSFEPSSQTPRKHSAVIEVGQETREEARAFILGAVAEKRQATKPAKPSAPFDPSRVEFDPSDPAFSTG